MPFAGSHAYWERRYLRGRTSGSGSYGANAEYKARFLNQFVAQYNIRSVIEFGCGDGNQLQHARYPAYTGLDVSPTIIARCQQLFANDASKQFKHLSQYDGDVAELSLSLDVTFHLVEEQAWTEHLHRLFDSATAYVIIYSTDSDSNEWGQASHMKNRKFTTWIKQYKPKWHLHHQEAKAGHCTFYIYAPRF